MNPLAIMQPGIGYEDCSPTPRSPTPRPDSNSSTRRRSSLFHIGDIHMRNERKSLLREGSNSSLKTGKSKRRSRSPFGGRRRTSLPHVKAPKEQQAASVQELDDDKQSSRRRSLFHIQDPDATVTPPGTRHDTTKAERRKNRRRRSSLFHVNQLTQGNGRSNSTGRALRADDDRSVTSNKSNKSLNSSLSLFSGKNPFTRNRGQDHHPKRRSHKDKMDKSMKEHSNSTRATELMDRSSKDHSISSHNSGSGRHHRRHHSSSNLKGADKDHSRRSSRRHSDGKRRSKSGNRVLSADDELTKNMKDMEKLVQALQKSPESRKILQEHLHKKQPQNFAPVGYVSAPRGT